ncbi:DUF5085 family protein [Heyndrickxia sporothermodurans]|uniref:DUF5085 family protein n=1 Tax=Heyndrickxia sporothermodurans TaxID=46224 RepID=A0A150KMX4_9BACI|nr:DUF5085 family protein [Heyndrickxia sporothermodurans]KYC97190.1 hypothetical protein B4102_0845 [Heyndrickxia sporothermodurans]MBL5773125.1 DUF5085 family protein [Heyndrickxia sporothermodurans]MBL5780139.1 DUF5085 family protein [Heyndrickxia sporothermodurans]MBL5783727.1 DUF5085 family protein [Heyndrickxia sporothermodurans]MBL5790803.1 DUF5085 family protein [Heyndrickxia sporothermodurans]
MIVREESLVIRNVVTVEEVIPHDEWFLPALGLRRNLVNEDIYYTSPVVFKVEEMKNEPSFGKYTYYIGLNTEVEVGEDANFKQLEYLEITPAIYVRCPEVDELEEAYELLRHYAKENGLEIDESFYHVCFDAFDNVIMDIYAQVKEG